jgi:hypothetical protein
MLICVSANPAIDRRLQLESIAVLVDPSDVERILQQVKLQPMRDWARTREVGR